MKRFRLVSFSMVELAQRMTIWELRRTGNSPSYIIKSTGYGKTTVYRAVAKLVLRVKLNEVATALKTIKSEPKLSWQD